MLSQSMTLFGIGSSQMQLVKVRPLGWAIIQYEWCPYKKGKFEYTQGRVGESQVKIKAEDVVMLLQAKE